jgi:hypothetical protein
VNGTCNLGRWRAGQKNGVTIIIRITLGIGLDRMISFCGSIATVVSRLGGGDIKVHVGHDNNNTADT